MRERLKLDSMCDYSSDDNVPLCDLYKWQKRDNTKLRVDLSSSSKSSSKTKLVTKSQPKPLGNLHIKSDQSNMWSNSADDNPMEKLYNDDTNDDDDEQMVMTESILESTSPKKRSVLNKLTASMYITQTDASTTMYPLSTLMHAVSTTIKTTDKQTDVMIQYEFKGGSEMTPPFQSSPM